MNSATELPKMNETLGMIRAPQEPRRDSPCHELDESNLDSVLHRNPEKRQINPSLESDESNLDSVLTRVKPRQ
jgi:hypothetical protein